MKAMLRCREQGVEISLTALHAFAGEEALNELRPSCGTIQRCELYTG
mgnify:FL=1